PTPRPLSADEAASPNARIPPEFGDYLGPLQEGTTVFPGPVHLAELEQAGGTSIILGDLRVDGLLVNPPHRSLIITGSLHAGTLLTRGKLVVLASARTAGRWRRPA
ncbi:hypothetical protein, partial [Corallococcus sp. CA053C]|uniref:hypothetical protein n=1 Tax=Corallococcus sp. CA053C TaxID=2316732 RepID=UPI001315ACD4